MPFVDPDSVHDPTTGQAIPATWGDQIASNQNYFATDFPHCTVSHSTTQSLTANTLTQLSADTETSDIGGMHSTVTNNSRITIPTGEGGLYMCTATVEFAANTTGERLVRFLVDGTTAYESFDGAPNPTGGLATRALGLRFIPLAAGSYVEVTARQNSGGPLNAQLLDFTVRWVATA